MIARRRQNPPNDEIRDEGDSAFVGVNMKLAPDKLPPGQCALAINKTLRTGAAATRGGAITPVHFNPARHPQTFSANGDTLLISLTWTADNGSDLKANLQGWTMGEPSTLETVGWGGVSQWIVLGVLYAAVEIGTNRIDILVRSQAIAEETGDAAKATLLAWWEGASQSADGDATVKAEVSVWSGGTWALNAITGRWENSGGEVVAQTAWPLQLYTDQFPSGDNGYIAALEIYGTSASQSSIYLSALHEILGSAGYVATEPALPAGILRTGRFTDTSGLVWTLLATRETIWQVRHGATPRPFTLPVSLVAPGDFVQFGGQVLLFRENDQVPLSWDGTPEGEWALLEQVEPADPNEFRLLPNAATAELIGNRLAVPYGRDYVVLSDVLSYYYDPVRQIFAINQGGADALVRIVPFTASALLCFKSHSIFMLEQLTGDLGQASLREINREIGLAAPQAVAPVGADVLFLARDGVYRVSQIFDDRIATAPVAVSDPIEPFFRERVHWAAIAGAQAVTVGEYFYLALPIDRAAGNNALLCYNLATQQWEGWHTLPVGYQFDHLFTAEFDGRRRLFAADARRGAVMLLGEGPIDMILGEEYPIADELLTRGYALGGAGWKTFEQVEVGLGTWWPNFNVQMRADGVNETSVLATQVTRSRTESMIFGQSTYDLTNAEDDHGREKRQDYAVFAGDGAMLGANGIVPMLTQQSAQRYPFRRRGRYAQVRVTSTQGRCEVMATRVEARHEEPLTRTQL